MDIKDEEYKAASSDIINCLIKYKFSHAEGIYILGHVLCCGVKTLGMSKPHLLSYISTYYEALSEVIEEESLNKPS